MGRPFQFRINDRRQSVVHFLNEGLSPREIARKLGCRIEIIERDIKAIEADREIWDLVDQTGVDYSALKEEIRLEEKERLAEMKRLKALEATVEALQKRTNRIVDRPNRPHKVISRGPKGSKEKVMRRRAAVLELQNRGLPQREIARILNTPLRTIQRDYALLKRRVYEIYKALEIETRKRLSVFTNEEVMEVFLGSPERQEELKARPLDGVIQYDLKWVKKGEKWID